IKLGEIGASLPAVGRELDGSLKFCPYLFRQTRGFQEIGVIGLLAVDSAQPEVIKAVVGVKRDSFFAGRDADVPGVEFELSAAKQVISVWRGGSVDLLLEGLHRQIHATGGEKLLGCVGCGGE